ncbi:hypothetical protein [Halorubrum aethiopicum]|uniref:hypothetical protein n=1 Tax=Halorubrum aethiopicum TaxID=1758255 RepID=UPI0008377453|nr:hypothetical protein [Halorubrum aethiopicum]
MGDHRPTAGRIDTIEQSATDSNAIERLRSVEQFDRIRVVPLDVTLRVLDMADAFGREGVRATSENVAYLLAAEPAENLPDIRVDRWDGTTFRPVLRTSRVTVSPEGTVTIPAGVRVDRDRRTGGGQARIRTDGGHAPIETVRDLAVGDRVRVQGDAIGTMTGTVDRVDDTPPIASEIFEGARHVFLDVEGDRYRILSYQTMTGDDAVHLAEPDGGMDGTWQRCGSCTRVDRLSRADEQASP